MACKLWSSMVNGAQSRSEVCRTERYLLSKAAGLTRSSGIVSVLVIFLCSPPSPPAELQAIVRPKCLNSRCSGRDEAAKIPVAPVHETRKKILLELTCPGNPAIESCKLLGLQAQSDY